MMEYIFLKLTNILVWKLQKIFDFLGCLFLVLFTDILLLELERHDCKALL